MSIHGCHEKTRASPACLYLTIQEYWHLPGVAVEFVRKLPSLTMSGRFLSGRPVCLLSIRYVHAEVFRSSAHRWFPAKIEIVGYGRSLYCLRAWHLFLILFVCMVFFKNNLLMKSCIRVRFLWKCQRIHNLPYIILKKWFFNFYHLKEQKLF